LLFEHLHDIQGELRRDVKLYEFAAMLGLDDKTFNHIYNGRRLPTEKQLESIYLRLKDVRFYEAMGKLPPNPRLLYVNRNWGKVPEEWQDAILDIVAEHTDDHRPTKE